MKTVKLAFKWDLLGSQILIYSGEDIFVGAEIKEHQPFRDDIVGIGPEVVICGHSTIEVYSIDDLMAAYSHYDQRNDDIYNTLKYIKDNFKELEV